MGRTLLILLAIAAGAAGVLAFQHSHRRELPDAPAIAERVRDVARLETLDVTLYKKVSFEPEPTPQPSVWGDLAQWAQFSVRPPHGKAIVFAHAHLGYDLAKLTAADLRVEKEGVRVRLPPITCQVELLPGETEVVDSSLDSAQTAALLDKAKTAFERETLADPNLRARVQRSAESSIRALLFGLGFRQVEFGDLPTG